MDIRKGIMLIAKTKRKSPTELWISWETTKPYPGIASNSVVNSIGRRLPGNIKACIEIVYSRTLLIVNNRILRCKR